MKTKVPKSIREQVVKQWIQHKFSDQIVKDGTNKYILLGQTLTLK